MILLQHAIHGRGYERTEDGPRFRSCAPHSVLSRLGDKWTILVMSHLAVADGHRLRFSELKHGIEGITQRLLTLTLRNCSATGWWTGITSPKCRPASSMS